MKHKVLLFCHYSQLYQVTHQNISYSTFHSNELRCNLHQIVVDVFTYLDTHRYTEATLIQAVDESPSVSSK